MDATFKVCRDKEAMAGGFYAEIDGYLCFVFPRVRETVVIWKWSIQSGGGWTVRGGRDVKTHVTGESWSAEEAQTAIQEAIDDLPD